jgi:hypothetical protein
MNDLKFAIRQLLKNPGFTAMAVLTLALGIGANTAIFSVVNAVLLRPLPYPESERLVWVSERGANFPVMSISYPNFTDWLAQQNVFEHLGVYNWTSYSLTGDGEPVRLDVSRVSAGALAAVRQQVLALDPDQPIYSLHTLSELRDRSLQGRRAGTTLLGIFAGVALALAVIGLYGVLAYAVTQRTREIGIRMALGARRRDVLRLVLRQGMNLALIGAALGVLGALGLTRWLTTLLYEIKPTDPLTLLATPLLLVAVALFACWLPARRAAKVDPMEALRYE